LRLLDISKFSLYISSVEVTQEHIFQSNKK
jgi:hypothetical protein